MDVQVSIPVILQTNVGVDDRQRTGAEFTRFTAGAHVSYDDTLSWRIEGYVQGGEHPTQTSFDDDGVARAMDALAWMVGGRVGYDFNAYLTPVLWVDYLSGDLDRGDRTAGAFDTLFATNHAFYGSMDRFLDVPVATQNGGLLDVALKNTAELGPGTLKSDLHYFMWGTESARQHPDGSRFTGPIGIEVDLLYSLPVVEALKVVGGVSLFVDLGDFALRPDGTPKDKTVHDWTWLMLDLNLGT
jgi:hypothetical protein